MMRLKRYCLAIALASVLFLVMGLPASAMEAGRYQALEISVGKKSEYNIFILKSQMVYVLFDHCHLLWKVFFR